MVSLRRGTLWSAYPAIECDASFRVFSPVEEAIPTVFSRISFSGFSFCFPKQTGKIHHSRTADDHRDRACRMGVMGNSFQILEEQSEAAHFAVVGFLDIQFDAAAYCYTYVFKKGQS